MIQPDWTGAPARIGALSTERSGGVSLGPYGDLSGRQGLNLGVHVGDVPEHVAQNRRIVRALLPAEPAWLTQVHGIKVVDAAQVTEAVEADAGFTTAAGVVCLVQAADCLPVLFCDVEGRAVAAAHAGWRGLAHGVLEQTVGAMRAAGAGDILAWLGPAIGPQQFEVGQEVLDAFVGTDAAASAAFTATGQPGKYLADIYALARLRLAKAGGILCSGGTFCTVSDPARFYSYRRDKITGRMASMIWLK